MKKEFEQQKLSAEDEHKNKLLEKYGGEVSITLVNTDLSFSASCYCKITSYQDLLFLIYFILLVFRWQ